MFNQENEDLESERFPSGQRGQTVNLLAMPSEVRILPSPPGLPASDSLNHSTLEFKLNHSNGVSRVHDLPLSDIRGRESDFRRETCDSIEVKREFCDWMSSIGGDSLLLKRGSSSVGRASAFQAEGRGFDPRFPLHCDKRYCWFIF